VHLQLWLVGFGCQLGLVVHICCSGGVSMTTVLTDCCW